VFVEYDSLGRSFATTWAIDGTPYRVHGTFDGYGRPSRLFYPAGGISNFAVRNSYGPHGHLASVVNNASGALYWRLDSATAALQIEKETFGNSVQSTRQYEPLTGRLDLLHTSRGATTIQDVDYDYFANGSVFQRRDNALARVDTHFYDALDRLTGWSTARDGVQFESHTFGYAWNGNLTSERTVRAGKVTKDLVYKYGENGAGVHAMTSVGGDSYGYDIAGRQTTGPDRSIGYTTFDLPSEIKIKSDITTFDYDGFQVRAKRSSPTSSTIYVGGIYEKRNDTSQPERHVYHVLAGGRAVAQVSYVAQPQSTEVLYVHDDLLSSVSAVTDSSGAVVERFYYDPWGRRVDASDQPLPDAPPASGMRHGFTQHEHDDDLGLINAQGRIYDPKIRRMLTPDPLISGLAVSQSLNRYSYVLNNPTSHIDPSGLAAEDSDPREDFGDFSGVTLLDFDETTGEVSAPGSSEEPEKDFSVCSGTCEGNRGREPKSGEGNPKTSSSDDRGSTGGKSTVSSLGELVEGGIAGVAAGALLGASTGYALGVITAINPVAGLVVGLGLGAYALYGLATGGAEELYDSGARIAAGEGTFDDTFKLGAVIGGGLTGRRGFRAGAAQGRQLALPFGQVRGPQLELPLVPKEPLTRGAFVHPNGRVEQLASGFAGPAERIPTGTPGFDIITRGHVEGHTAALMRQLSLPSGRVYINNPVICQSCSRNLPSMLPHNARLEVVLPDGTVVPFIGNAR
jgi:RHS repeat-associated protein